MASPARTFAPDQARELLDHLTSQIRRTYKRPDERHVHDLRVAIRRFTQAIVILKPCLNPESVKDIRANLKGIMSLAGEVRNSDITATLLAKMKENPPAGMAAIRRASLRKFLAALESWTLQDFASQWRIQLEPCRNLSRTAARKLIRESIAKAAERLHECAADIGKSLKALHKLRIAAKKLRYTLELAGAPVDPIKDLQTQLGDINDYRSAVQLLKQIRGTGPLRKALAKKQRKKVRRFRREFKEPPPAR